MELWGNAPVAGKLGMVIAVATIAMAAAYAVKPSERKLALMRPLSLATIFGGLGTFLMGVSTILGGISATPGQIAWTAVAAGTAECVAPLAAAFTSLMIAWVLVAGGMRRQ